MRTLSLIITQAINIIYKFIGSIPCVPDPKYVRNYICLKRFVNKLFIRYNKIMHHCHTHHMTSIRHLSIIRDWL